MRPLTGVEVEHSVQEFRVRPFPNRRKWLVFRREPGRCPVAVFLNGVLKSRQGWRKPDGLFSSRGHYTGVYYAGRRCLQEKTNIAPKTTVQKFSPTGSVFGASAPIARKTTWAATRFCTLQDCGQFARVSIFQLVLESA